MPPSNFSSTVKKTSHEQIMLSGLSIGFRRGFTVSSFRSLLSKATKLKVRKKKKDIVLCVIVLYVSTQSQHTCGLWMRSDISIYWLLGDTTFLFVDNYFTRER